MPQYDIIGVVGATGVVGTELLSILHTHGHEASTIRCFGSPRSVGSTIKYGSKEILIESINEIRFAGLDYAVLCANAEIAQHIRSELADTETVIIDNSSAFRLESDVPLVIPEINSETVNEHTRLIANPNCSTVMLLTALHPIRESYGIRSIQVATYQAVSGAGRAGVEELYANTKAVINGLPTHPEIFPHPCAFNVFEHESDIDPQTGFNGEETKMIQESQKIWNTSAIEIIPTCVRVPVERAHSQAIVVEIYESANLDAIRECLTTAGVDVSTRGTSCTPLDAAGADGVKVGRIRIVNTASSCTVILWACCDQLRKGAALNAYQILNHVSQLRSRTLSRV